MNPPSVDIKTLILNATSIATSDLTQPWSVHISELPDKPNELIGLLDVPGPGPINLLDKTTVQQAVCQVIVRSLSYTDGYSKSQEIASLLNMNPSATIGDTSYWGITQMNSIEWLGADAERRHMFSVSFAATRQ